MAYRASWKNQTPSTSLVVASTPQIHDVLIAFGVTDATGSTFTWPTGFTQIGTQDTTADAQTLACAIKIDASGSEGSLTIDCDSNCVGGIVAFSGRDNVNTQDFTFSLTNNNTGTPANAWTLASSSKTPGHDDCDLCAIFGSDVQGNASVVNTFATTTGTTGAWTTRQDATDAGFLNVGLGTATQATAGALVCTATGTSSGDTAGRALFLIGLRASGGGGGRTTKNTRAAPLGMNIGMGWRMRNRIVVPANYVTAPERRIVVPERLAA